MPIQQPERYGESSGNHFYLLPSRARTVKTIEAWAGRASGAYQGAFVVKGIRLTWFNGDNSLSADTLSVYNNRKTDDSYQKYEFQPDETIKSMNIYSGGLIDRIEFATSMGGHFTIGGDGGSPNFNVGEGFLVGFDGTARWEVDSITPRFAHKVTSVTPEWDVIYD